MGTPETIPEPIKPDPAPPPGPAPVVEPVAPFFQRIITVATGLLIVVLVIHLLQFFATVLQQLFIAAFIACAILPAHRWLMARGLPRAVAGVLIVLIFLGFSFGVGQMTYSSLNDMKEKLPDYQKRLRAMTKDAAKELFGLDADPLGAFLDTKENSKSAQDLLRTAVSNFLTFLSQMFVVLIYLAFLLAERGGLLRRLQTAYGVERAPGVTVIVERIATSIEQYIGVLTWISLMAGLIVWAALQAFHVPYAFFWGFLTFALNFIPYLGSLVATVLPILLTIVDDDRSVGRTVGVTVVLVLIQNGIGYFIQPRLTGNRLDLSPLVIILSLAFWGTIWGIAGMILAVPLVVVIKTVLENIPQTKPITTLLSNQ